MLFLDLNRFKTLNDSLGHSVGDLLLKAVGDRLRVLARRRDLVGRFGGDEFAVILRGGITEAEAISFAERAAVKLRSHLR